MLFGLLDSFPYVQTFLILALYCKGEYHSSSIRELDVRSLATHWNWSNIFLRQIEPFPDHSRHRVLKAAAFSFT
jgi:hypothetical protein